MVKPAAPRAPRLDARKDPESQALRKDVLRELEALHKRVDTLIGIVNEIDTTTGNAPIGASYVTATVSGVLTDERVLTGGTNITIDNTTPGQAIVNAASGAPVGASYVVLGLNGTLTSERVLTEGNGVDITDGGANGNVTVAVDESELAMNAPQYLTLANTAALPNERRLDAGSGIALVDNGAGSTCEVHSTFFVEDVAGSTTIDPCTSLTFDGADGFVVTNPAGQAARVDLANVPGTALANDAVTFAKLQNITSARVLGRTTAASGDVEELDVSGLLWLGTAGVISTRIATNRLAGRSTAGSGVLEAITLGNGLTLAGGVLDVDGLTYVDVDDVLYDVDFSTLANNTFANGTETIDGVNWTAGAVSNATRTTFDILNGTGLRWTAPTSGAANVFTTATQSAAHLYVPLSTLIPTWDPEWTILIDVYLTTEVYENASDNFRVGIWLLAADGGSGSNRLRAAIKGKGPGAVSTVGTIQVSTLTFESVDFSAHNCIGLKMDAVGVGGARYGTYGSDFPVMNMVAFNTSTSTAGNVFTDTYGRLFMAFANGASDASPTSAVTVRRLRVRRAA